ncbi:Panacea domain-containing protein [Rhodoplanes serenus]|uniref:Panacea domain-containing protein n=1 Tax=Rhodoplanes serenus TaxID=200615 RepID=UPI000DACF52C|nr:type II toxin-antitoxin system antitoxin SocA domain-containing protein [Rhodoplanes serenus]RAI31771.1 hypothetical protein CH340_17625 [Rhodoplanes serenus]
MAHDVRSIANFVLDLAKEQGRAVTNLSINKIVFFLHSNYLAEFGRPLVTAKVEAWDYGPVFRELYREFKKFEGKAISEPARRINPGTGESETCTHQLDESERLFLEPLTTKYLKFSASALVNMSHISGGPWDQVWNHSTRSRPSMHISDDIIKAWHIKAARH